MMFKPVMTTLHHLFNRATFVHRTDAEILHSLVFESGVITIEMNQTNQMADEENQSCETLNLSTSTTANNEFHATLSIS